MVLTESVSMLQVLALALGGGDDDQPASLEPIETLETLDAALEPLEALSTSQLDKAGGFESLVLADRMTATQNQP